MSGDNAVDKILCIAILTQRNHIAQIIGPLIHLTQKERKMLRHNLIRNKNDVIQALPLERSGRCVWLVTQLLHCREHTLSLIGIDITIIVEYIRDDGLCHTGLPGDISSCDFFESRLCHKRTSSLFLDFSSLFSCLCQNNF